MSHHDLMLIFERALRRAGLHVAHTQGFNPRPKLTFALALPLGVESHDEIVDVDLEDTPDASELFDQLGKHLPPGLDLMACEVVEPHAKLHVRQCDFFLHVDAEAVDGLKDSLERFQHSDEAIVERQRKGKIRRINLKSFAQGLTLRENQLSFSLHYSPEGGAKPAELLQWLGLDPLEIKVVKTKTHLAETARQ